MTRFHVPIVALATVCFSAAFAACDRTDVSTNAPEESSGQMGPSVVLPGDTATTLPGLPSDGYSRQRFWVRLKDGFTLDDLKSMGDYPELSLSSATFDTVYGSLYVIRLASPTEDTTAVLTRLRSFPPVLHAHRLAVGGQLAD